jgi:hypothetical protein
MDTSYENSSLQVSKILIKVYYSIFYEKLKNNFLCFELFLNIINLRRNITGRYFLVKNAIRQLQVQCCYDFRYYTN